MNLDQQNKNIVLSISIVTYQVEKQEFSAVLKSLNVAIKHLKSMNECSVSISIIDNANQTSLLQEIIASLQQPYAQYTLITNPQNIGYGRAHNIAIRNSQANYHLILNPDVILDKDGLDIGLKYLGSNPQVSAVTPNTKARDGSIQYLCKQYPSVLVLLLRGFAPKIIKVMFKEKLGRYELRKEIDSGVVTDVSIISGCFMLCDTKRLKKVNGFDEQYFLYFEDFALSMELGRVGKLTYLPGMKIQHFGGNSAKKGLKHVLMFSQSAYKFFRSYGWKLN